MCVEERRSQRRCDDAGDRLQFALSLQTNRFRKGRASGLALFTQGALLIGIGGGGSGKHRRHRLNSLRLESLRLSLNPNLNLNLNLN